MDGECFVSIEEDGQTLTALLAKLDRQLPAVRKADTYYAGTQPISFLAPEVRAHVGKRLTSLVINWPRTIVDSVQRRMYVEGFRIGKGQDVDDELWRIWQANDLDEWTQLGQVDALVHARSFLLVWGNDDDPETPTISTESAHQMVVEYAPGTRTVRAAAKRFDDGDTKRATLYLPDRVVRWQAPRALSRSAPWQFDEELDNPVGAVTVVPLVNRPLLANLDGASELNDVMPMADAINKLATDMMVVSEYHAGPRRWATGIALESAGNASVQRMQAQAQEYWDQAKQGKTWLAAKDVKFGQFEEASLDNFVSAISLLTSQVAAIAGLPPHYLGINTDNPASAEAIRSAETTLVERAREKQRTWGGAYERAMRLAVAVREGVPLVEVPREFRSMETIWRDPRTETKAVDADAAVKLLSAGLIDDVQGQEDIGLTPTQREAIAERRRVQAETAATADVSARMNFARQLQQTDGLSQNAALAAVGLLAAASANAAEQ